MSAQIPPLPAGAYQRFLPSDFEEKEIADAQAALDFHPDNSPYWDSRSAQDVMLCAQVCGLSSRKSNAERRELYRQASEQSRREEELGL